MRKMIYLKCASKVNFGVNQKMRTTGKAYLVPQYTAIHAWHRAAHRSLKPFLW